MVLSVRIAIDALERRGVDASAILKAAHLSREALASPENRVPYETAQRIWETAAAAVKDERLPGIHVAEELAIGDYDIFDYIQATASTVGEGLQNLKRYARLLYDHSNFELIAEPLDARLVRRVAKPTPQRDEFTFSWVLTRSRQFSGTHWLPDSLRFQHPAHGSDREVERLFGCPCTFGGVDSELRFPLTVLQLPHKHADLRGCSLSCCATRTGCSLRIPKWRAWLPRLAARLRDSWRGARPRWRPLPAPCTTPPERCSAGWRPRASATRGWSTACAATSRSSTSATPA